ncbi:MAG: hypothetical protein MSH49_00325 [[Eubacterium] saphenum]|nr:hypothetical protein [[Eubacterium] saphenum]
MKNFLSSTKGKIIAGAVTLAVIAGVVALIVLLRAIKPDRHARSGFFVSKTR